MNAIISFELAKMLKEKGFDIKCLICYLEDGSKQLSSGDEGDFEKYNHNLWDNYSAPTIAEVVMWLYEKHGIWIEVIETDLFDKFFFQIKRKDNTRLKNGDYNSPTEAYESAIKYVLTNLI